MPSPTLQAERIRRFAVGVAFAGFLLLFYRVMEPFIAALVWAVILALALWPLHRRLLGRVPRPSWMAATLMTSSIALVILAPMIMFGLLLVGEARALGEEASGWLSGEQGDLEPMLRTLPGVGDSLADGLVGWRGDPQGLQDVLRHNTETMISLATRAMTNLGRNIFKLVVCVFTTWFLFRHGDVLKDQLKEGVGRLGGERAEKLLGRIRETVRAVVYGLVMTALAQAVLTAFGFWVAGASYPLLLGALMFVCSFIPFGPPLVWVPASLSFFVDGELAWGIATFVWGAAVISSMDNILRPLFIGQVTRMPVLLVFMGVIGGLMAFGMVGMFVGPVIIAVALALWEDWVEHGSPDSLTTAKAPPVEASGGAQT